MGLRAGHATPAAVLGGLLAPGLLLASCGGAGSPSPEPEAPAPVEVRVTQYSHDQVNEVLAVNVGNVSTASLTVASLDVQAPGLAGPGPVDFGATLGPGRAYDLRVPVGTPVCDREPRGRAVVVVVLEGRDEPLEVVPEEGADLLRRLHDDECAIREARAAVPLRWAGTFPIHDGAAQGTLLVGPVAGGTRVRLVEVVGTTSFNADTSLLPRTVRAGDRLRLPVRIRPARCDAHGIGEGPEKFHFLVRLRLRGGLETLVPVVVGRPAQDGLLEFVLDACDLG